MKAFLSGKKTYIVAGATFVYAVVVIGWQQHDWNQALNLVFGSAFGATIRAAIAKVGN